MAQDIVDTMLLEIQQTMPDIQEEMLAAIEEKIRMQYGGQECYVGKKRIKYSQKQKAVTEYLGGKPLKDIEKNQGLSRRTLYRHLKK